MTLVDDYVALVQRLLTEDLNPQQVDAVEFWMRMIDDDFTREERREAIKLSNELLQRDRD